MIRILLWALYCAEWAAWPALIAWNHWFEVMREEFMERVECD